MNVTVIMKDGELWWGSSSAHGEAQPFSAESEYSFNMTFGTNQTMPLFISNQGRYIWCEKPMKVRMAKGEISLSAESEILLCEAGSSLRDAYLAASRNHFAFSGKVPPEKFFTTAQYNTCYGNCSLRISRIMLYFCWARSKLSKYGKIPRLI